MAATVDTGAAELGHHEGRDDVRGSKRAAR